MFNSFFEKLLCKNEMRKSIVILCFLVGTMILMRFYNSPLKNEIAPAGIISFEIAKDIKKSVLILNTWNEEAMSSAKKSLYFDFLFLCIYSTFIGLLIFKLNRTLKVKKHIITEIMIGAVFLSAFFDVIENVALLKLIYGNLEQLWSSVAYYFAILKFVILAIAIVYILVGSCFLLFKKIVKPV